MSYQNVLSIIDNAKKSGYIDLKKDVYSILEGGEYLIESIARLGIVMDKYKTSELGKALKQVYHGQMSVEDSVKLAESEIAAIFGNRDENPEMPKVDTGKYGEIVGECPLCSRHVVRGKYNYGCMGYTEGCQFKMGITILKRDIPISEARRLLREGSTERLNGFISKNGKRFNARLILNGADVKFAFDD